MNSIFKRLKRKIKRALSGKSASASVGARRGMRIAKQNDVLAAIDADALAEELLAAGGVHRESYLFITLDSCRFDTFAAAEAPNIKGVGDWYEAEAPATFTFPSHMAMFIGYTPGVAASREPLRNPKVGRIWRLAHRAGTRKLKDHRQVPGRNIIDGFNQLGYHTIGTGAAAWFNDQIETTQPLVADFQDYAFTGIDINAQLGFVLSKMNEHRQQKLFVFINLGETHVPYHHRGAPWSMDENPCVPFRDDNSREKSQERQRLCLEYSDRRLEALITLFMKSDASLVICGDHGDCHGEDGLWAHGFYHEKVMKVPMVYRLRPID